MPSTPARNAHAPESPKKAEGKGKEEILVNDDESELGEDRGPKDGRPTRPANHSNRKDGGPSTAMNDQLMEEVQKLQGENDAYKEMLETKKNDEEAQARHQDALEDIAIACDVTRTVPENLFDQAKILAGVSGCAFSVGVGLNLIERATPSFFRTLGNILTKSKVALGAACAGLTALSGLCVIYKLEEEVSFRYVGGVHVGPEDDVRADTNSLLKMKHNSVIANFDIDSTRRLTSRLSFLPSFSQMACPRFTNTMLYMMGKYVRPVHLNAEPICLELVSQALGGHTIHTDLGIAATHISNVCKRNCTVNIDRKYALTGHSVYLNSECLAKQLNAIAADETKRLPFRERP